MVPHHFSTKEQKRDGATHACARMCTQTCAAVFVVPFLYSLSQNPNPNISIELNSSCFLEPVFSLTFNVKICPCKDDWSAQCTITDEFFDLFVYLCCLIVVFNVQLLMSRYAKAVILVLCLEARL